jgi:hypothetical protein
MHGIWRDGSGIARRLPWWLILVDRRSRKASSIKPQAFRLAASSCCGWGESAGWQRFAAAEELEQPVRFAHISCASKISFTALCTSTRICPISLLGANLIVAVAASRRGIIGIFIQVGRKKAVPLSIVVPAKQAGCLTNCCYVVRASLTERPGTFG